MYNVYIYNGLNTINGIIKEVRETVREIDSKRERGRQDTSKAEGS